jgi:tellurite resistance protein TerC
MSTKKALIWVIIWVSIAMAFNVVVYLLLGRHKAIEFLTGYIVEESLSVDNLFVFLLLFRYFKIERHHQRRVLNWGIIGVIILRGIFILSGSYLIANFGFIMYIFGAILVYSGYRMAFGAEKEIHPEQNKTLRIFKRFMNTTHEYDGNKFVTKKDGKNYATPLLVCLIVIESTDLVFAIDSIPAIFAITTDPFIVFSSNILAVLGLRSMYFLLSAIADRFEYVKKGVGVILIYVGVKMLLPIINPHWHIPVLISLFVIIFILSISVLISIMLSKSKRVR